MGCNGFGQRPQAEIEQEILKISAPRILIARQMFVAALAIEKHGDVGIARQPHDAPLSINAATQRGMLLMAYEGVNLIDESKGIGINLDIRRGEPLGNGTNVGSLIRSGILGPG